jgi:hypothetical protein
MRHVLKTLLVIFIVCLLALIVPINARAVTGRVVKVLPHLLDLKGRHALSPSLYDRDAYQAYLRKRPEEVSGLRFDVKWKAETAKDVALKLRVELRGKAPAQTTFEKEVTAGMFSRWTPLLLTGDDYKKFGEVTAWRVTLWDGEQMLGEQKSFLW